MATEMTVLVGAVRDDLRGQVVGYLDDNELAGLIGSALSWLNGQAPSVFSYTVSGQAQHRVVTTSIVTPEIDPLSKWGALVRTTVLMLIARGGALAMAERNMGSFSVPSHSANMSGRVVQHRFNYTALKAEVDSILKSVKNMREHESVDVDFGVVDW